MGRFLLILFILISNFSLAQTQPVKGRVVSASEPSGLPGVSVIVKGTSQGTVTDMNGEFSLEVSSGATLVFSFVGYTAKEVIYEEQSSLDVTLIEESTELTEVVVVGYASVQKRDLTGSVTSIKADKFKDISLNGIDQALQGQAPGVQVTSSSGTPGGGVSVRIRGSSSINASNRPLIVIDGIPAESGSLSLRDFGGQDDNALSLLSPADIESVEILKDAYAKAIYGSRGANGVIMYKTKKGRKDATRINVDVQRGIIDPVKKVDLLNSKQLLELQREAYVNAGKNPDAAGLIPGVTDAVNTDWQDEIFRTGIMQQYQLSASGGDQNTTYYMSGNYRDEEGVQLNNRFQRLSGTFNVERNFNSRLRVGTSIIISYALNNRVKGDNFLDGVYSGALKSLPYDTPYDEDGNLIGPSSPMYAGFPNFNPVAQAVLPRFQTKTLKVFGNITATYKFNDNFNLRVLAGMDHNDVKEDQFESSQTAIGGFLPSVGGQGYGIYSTNTSAVITANAILNYTKDIGKDHHVSALIGSEIVHRPAESSSVVGRLFPSDDFTYITSAGIVDNGSSFKVRSGMISFLSDVKYDYKDRYLFSASFRTDGSSRFGSGNRFAFFPAVAAAWRISEEDFFNSAVLNDLKLRASYGVTGNEGIPEFRFLGTWSSSTYSGASGVGPENLENQNLGWESTGEINIGVDASLFTGRIQATLDVYHKKTKELLFAEPYPLTTGFPNVWSNVGNIVNKGIELGVSTINIDGAIKWSTDINLAKNLNKVTYLADTVPIYTGYQADGSTATNIVKVGEPLGSFSGLRFLGVDPATGDAMYDDVNNDGKITEDDAVIIGNANPKLFGGITNRLVYKQFDLNIFFQFSLGNDVLNFTKESLVNSGSDMTTNQSTYALRRWQKPGDITDVPKYQVQDEGVANSNSYHSSRFIEDGSYLRLKNLGFGYTLPGRLAEKVKMERVRFYVSATNLWTLTKYSGGDPEVSTLDGSTTAQGIDFYTLPQVRTISIGLNATIR